jgi:AraC-like DNA-binding protein
MGRTWSTAALPAREQFAFWRDVVWQAFTPVSLTAQDTGTFASTVAVGRAGPIRVARIRSRPQSVSRTASLVASSPGDVYFVNLPLSRGTSGAQGGRTADLAPGDFVTLDGAQPFELRFSEPFEQVSVMLPHDVLAPALRGRDVATGLRVRGTSGVGAVASRTMLTLAQRCDAIGEAEGRELAGCLAELIALASGGARMSPRLLDRRLVFQALLDAAQRDLDDPCLTPGAVAEQVGVSVRHLQQLFAENGTTFGRWLLRRRLELCRQDLLDPALSGWTVAELAARRGLCDPSYFSRVFKAEYGVTPRELRRGVLRADAEHIA